MIRSAPETTPSRSALPRNGSGHPRIPRERAIVTTLATSGLVVAFMQTLVIPILPQLPEMLDTTRVDTSWVLTATLLSAAISTPISGRLGDMYGKRRTVLVLLSMLVLGSLIAALSNTLGPLVVGRALQGLGLGVVALSVSILRDVIHPRNVPRAVALVSATIGIGGALGLPLAAVIAQYANWHWLFWLAGGLGSLTLALVAAVIPADKLRSGGRFDFLGAMGLAVGLVAILLPVSKAGQWGLTSPLTLALLIGGTVVLGLWCVFELRVGDPLVDLRIATRRPVLLTNLGSIAVGFAYYLSMVTLPILLQAPPSGSGFGMSLIASSLCIMPIGLVMFCFSPVSAALSKARGPRTSLVLGCIVIAIGLAAAALLLGQVWHVLLVSTVIGIGVGLAYSAMPMLIMRLVPPSETAAANGLNSVMRMLGSTMSTALVGVILSAQFLLVRGESTPTRDAYEWVFIVGAVVAVAGSAIALFIPKQLASQTSATPEVIPLA